MWLSFRRCCMSLAMLDPLATEQPARSELRCQQGERREGVALPADLQSHCMRQHALCGHARNWYPVLHLGMQSLDHVG